MNTVLLSRLVPPAPCREAVYDCSDPERGTRDAGKVRFAKRKSPAISFCAFRVFAQAVLRPSLT